ncbi:MAG: ABC transporter permease, partial [Lachnospiraceae bacterium]|nr:ABC transporter permease [Lachnospiraceae bacterium]
MDSTARQSIRQLSIRSMLASRSRSIISLLAIILTTLLFTALFTIALSINHSFQQANFMMVGGYSHGGFKNMTYEQAMELCDDPRIKEYGLRLFVGIPEKAPFNKSQVEVSYCNENSAKWMYLEPSIGAFPAEGTNEAATDKKVLDRLGIEPRIGSEFTLTFDVDGQETTETFVLSGWWESDEIIPASHVLIPESRAQEIFSQLGTKGKNG